MRARYIGFVVTSVELPTQTNRAQTRFARFAWWVLGYILLVVLWGAYVRATGSGAGCGNHWPLCNGEVIPRSAAAETVVEFTHRLSSGLALIAVSALCVWAFRLYARGHRVRLAATLALFFLLVEAALGAGLVLLEYVARNASLGRAIYLSAHLANTLVLLAALLLTAWFARDREGSAGRRPFYLRAALPVTLTVSITGAIAALGDTLFPASSITEGFRQETISTSHVILRLRLLHPAVAILCGFYLLWGMITFLRAKPSSAAVKAAWLAALLVLLQFIAGAVNVALLAPVWMQLLHLLLADLLWLALVIAVVEGGVASRLRPVPRNP